MVSDDGLIQIVTGNNNGTAALPNTLSSPSFLSVSDTIRLDPQNMEFSTFQEIWVRKPWPDIILRSLFVVPILLVGLIGNSAIIYSVCKFKAIRSKPTNLFILNMAIADLAATIVCANAALISDIYQNYVLGAFMCRFEGFIKITCLLVSIHSLVVLSYDRLISIVKPFWPRFTVYKSLVAIIIIWIVSMIMGSPLAYWRRLRERQWRDYLEVWCYEDVQYTKYYWLTITGFLIYLPMATMTIVFIVILAQMDRFEANLRRSSTCALQGNSSMKITYRRKIIKILFIYLLTSIICWTPFQLSPWFFETRFFSQLFASLSSAMNPIIFGFLSEPFRKILSKSVMFKLFNKIRLNDTENINNNNHNNNNENNNNTHQRTTNNNNDRQLGVRHHGNESKKQNIRALRRHTHGNINVDRGLDNKNTIARVSHGSTGKNKPASFNTLGLGLHNNNKLLEAIDHRVGCDKRHTVQLVDHLSQLNRDYKIASSFRNAEAKKHTQVTIKCPNKTNDNFIDSPQVDSSSYDDSNVIHDRDNNAIILGHLNSCFKDDKDEHVQLEKSCLDYISHDGGHNLFKGATSQSIDVSVGFESIDINRNDSDDTRNACRQLPDFS